MTTIDTTRSTPNCRIFAQLLATQRDQVHSALTRQQTRVDRLRLVESIQYRGKRRALWRTGQRYARQLSRHPLGGRRRVSSENVFARLERYLVRQATTPPSAAHWGERLIRRLWRPPVKHPGVNPPASAADLAAFEQTFSVALPDDVIRSYRHMNGTEDYTDLDAGWLRFWPIEEWKPVAHEFPGDPFVTDEPLSESFVCADHGISAWFFAIDLSPTRLGRAYSLVPEGAVLVALSFTGFVERALQSPNELFRY